MNVMRTVTIICWSVSAIVIIFLALLTLWVAAGNHSFSIGGLRLNLGFGILTGPYMPVGTYTIQTDGIDSLEIDWSSGAVTVKPHDGTEIVITEFAQRELNEEEKLRSSISGATLKIEITTGTILQRLPGKRLEVLIPHGLNGELNLVSAKSSSGRLTMSDITAASINLTSSSGGITISNIQADTVILRSSSGSVNVTDVFAASIKSNASSGSHKIMGTFENADITGSSGSIRIESGSVISTLKANTTSGGQRFSGSFNSIDASSSSGSIRIENTATDANLSASTSSGGQTHSGSYSNVLLRSSSGSVKLSSAIVPAQLVISTSSGGVRITIPDGEPITVHHTASSGGFSSEVSVIMQTVDAQFRISSTSGSTRILKS